MPILHVRNISDRMYRRLQEHADAEHRSLSAEVIALLEDALTEADSRAVQIEVLEQMRRHRRTFRPQDAGAPDSVELLREDRER